MNPSHRNRRAPGPAGTLLGGSLGEFRRDPLALLERAAREHGDIVRFRFGPVTAHLVNHPDLVQQVLVDERQLFDKRTRSVAKLRATCGESLLTADGELWQRHRRLVQRVFQPRALESYVPLMQSVIQERLDRWQRAAAAGGHVDIVSEMLQVTLQIAAQCLFGTDIRRDAPLIEDSLEVILDETWRRLESLVDLASISQVFQRTRYRKALRDIDTVVMRIIAERRLDGRPGDLLAALLAARDDVTGISLDERELRDVVMTLLLAGHEPTANALSWTFLLLAEHPDVAQRVELEIAEVMGDGIPDAVSLSKLQFTGQVFSEAIRLYPSIWVMERRAVVDTMVGGVPISAGSTVLVCPYVLHRHPEFWTMPDRFDPDRFAEERSRAQPRCAYIPFGIGPHVCIGQAMAQLVARITLAMVGRRFRLRYTAASRPGVRPGITLRHRDRAPMQLTWRG